MNLSTAEILGLTKFSPKIITFMDPFFSSCSNITKFSKYVPMIQQSSLLPFLHPFITRGHKIPNNGKFWWNEGRSYEGSRGAYALGPFQKNKISLTQIHIYLIMRLLLFYFYIIIRGQQLLSCPWPFDTKSQKTSF